MTDWQNRVVSHGAKPASEFEAHPENPKFHPDTQRGALVGSLDTVGWIDVVIESLHSGYMLDGHARVEEALKKKDESPIPFIVIDVTYEEEIFILAALDPIGMMAQHDAEALGALLHKVNTDSPALQQMFADLAAGSGVVDGGDGGDGDEFEDRGAGSGGSLLALSEVTIDDPRHKVESGEIWRVGRHVLICAEVLTDWPVWVKHLKSDADLFIPYPGAFAPLTLKAMEKRLVMVQPDKYICGHILDRYSEVHGEKEVKKA